jgi:hypothetical protein
MLVTKFWFRVSMVIFLYGCSFLLISKFYPPSAGIPIVDPNPVSLYKVLLDEYISRVPQPGYT